MAAMMIIKVIILKCNNNNNNNKNKSIFIHSEVNMFTSHILLILCVEIS